MFYAIPNTTSLVASPCPAPWDTARSLKVPVAAGDKLAYRAWCNDNSTRHAFISMVEPLDAGRRASWDEGNDPLKLHGLIVDYDADNGKPEDVVASLKDGSRKWPSEFPPSWVASSFSPGHLRVVWLFEKPVLLASDKHYKKLMQLLDRKIKFNKWFKGFEAEALGDACKYYMIGSDYVKCSDEVLPKSLLDLWSFEAAKMVQETLVTKKYQIPLDAVAKEVEARFPGRWTGPFTVGARGVRFWDPSARDTTGAVVLDNGMLAYSGEQAFLPWAKIFGTSFVDKFEADKISGVLDSLLYEEGTSRYWLQHNDQWLSMTPTSLNSYLKTRGFDARPDKSKTFSEVDQILNEVNLNRRISGAFPFIHFPHGVITVDQTRVLNTSSIKVLPPAQTDLCKEFHTARTLFPTIWSFLSGFFEETLSDPRSNNIQLEMFLSWLQHAYVKYYHQTPQPGLILIMAGPPSAGKSFILQKIISPLLGKSNDISSILGMNGSRYTDLLTKAPVAFIDDATSTTTPDEHKKFSEKIKGLVSNHKVTFDGKWKATGDVLWFGRIVICMNDDASSIRMMPDLSLSMAGKVTMLRISRDRKDGHRFDEDWAERDRKLAQELPYFARWLMDGWQVPDYLLNHGNTRYFLVPYKHPDLYHEAQERGLAHELFELLKEVMDDYIATQPDQGKNCEGWIGTSNSLMALMTGKFDMIMRKWTAARLGTALGMLSSKSNIERRRSTANLTQWFIPKNIAYREQGEFGEKVVSAADHKSEMRKRLIAMKRNSEAELKDSNHELVPEQQKTDTRIDGAVESTRKDA